jgi:uncharacterized protein (DUF4415 family)
MFEWDEEKRARNLAKHGLDFLDARRLFDGRPTVSVPARTETEARVLTGKVYTVVWTQRGVSRYTAAELDRMARAGASRSDWARADAKSDAEIEANAAGDDAEDGMTVDWTAAQIDLPAPKAVLHMRIDRDVLEFFRRGGRGYQTRINAVLRAYKDAHEPE